MDKRLILAVAGSGKTTNILERLDPCKRTLLVTYTENNFNNLRVRILQKYGELPAHVSLFTYFTFLYAFCFKPFLWRKYRSRGINWQTPPSWTMRLPRYVKKFYMDGSRRLYSNRIAKLLEVEGVLEDLNQRLEKYFDSFLVDEVQDFAGHDFNLLRNLAGAELEMLMVGDYFQHTYDTSRDGNANMSLYDNLEKYLAALHKLGLKIDDSTLQRSYRCSPSVCDYVSRELGIKIESHRVDDTAVEIITDEDKAQQVLNCQNTVKLFYQKHYIYDCFSQNWGASKGEDSYRDVCVVLNKTTAKQLAEKKPLSPKTRNKLYVAATRSSGVLYIVAQDLIEKCIRKSAAGVSNSD